MNMYSVRIYGCKCLSMYVTVYAYETEHVNVYVSVQCVVM